MGMTAKAQIEIMIRSRFPDVIAEHQFHPTRRWRFDWALPDQMVAFEFEGGVFVQGRHSRGLGLSADAVKYNTAQLMGWRVFRFTAAHVKGHAKEILDDVEYQIGIG